MSRPQLIHKTRTSMVLQWETAAGSDGHEIFRATMGPDGQPGDFVSLAYIQPVQPMFSDPGLEPATTYVYRVIEAVVEGEIREPEEWVLTIETLPETEFASTEEFVTKFVAPTFRRELTSGDGIQWCDEWWRHEEACMVLKALWESYECQRPTQPPEFPNKARADYLVYHFFPLFERLTTKVNAFRHCNPEEDKHKALLHQLPLVVNPTGDFPASFEGA